MLTSIFRYAFSAGCLLLCLAASAQQTAGDTATVGGFPPPKPQTDFRPTGVRFATDLIQGIRGIRSANFDGWEFNADVDFARYYFTVDYGKWARRDSLRNGFYENDGTYWRVGVDVNFLKKDPDRNMFFIGLRYASSSFFDAATYTFTDETFGEFESTFVNANARASWVEITTGLRVKIWKQFWMGYTARIKLFPSVRNVGNLQPYDIPGYGRASANNWWGFNYQILFRIPVRKQPAPPATDKQ